MEICFITDQPDVCQLLIKHLNDKKIHCFIQDSWIEFEEDLREFRRDMGLILCDYQFIGTCFFNIYEAIKQTGNPVPLVFYNDPVPDDESRVLHWINQLEEGLQITVPEELVPVLEKINRIISEPSIRRHISLLQPPVPLGYKERGLGTDGREIDLLSFRRRNRVTPVIYKLFKYMYENRGKEFSMKDLSRVLFKRCDSVLTRRNSVYSYISRLRRYLENEKTFDADILRSSQGCYELVIY